MSEFLSTKNNFQEDESLSLSDILRDSYFSQNKLRQFTETELYKTLDSTISQKNKKGMLNEIFREKNKTFKTLEHVYKIYEIGKNIDKKKYKDDTAYHDSINDKLTKLDPKFFEKSDKLGMKQKNMKHAYIKEKITNLQHEMSKLNTDKTLKRKTEENILNLADKLNGNMSKQIPMDEETIQENIQKYYDIGEEAKKSMEKELTKKLRMYAFVDACTDKNYIEHEGNDSITFNIGIDEIYTPNAGINMPNENVSDQTPEYEYYSYMNGVWKDTITTEQVVEDEVLNVIKEIWVPAIQFNKENHDKMMEFDHGNSGNEIDVSFTSEDYVWISGKNIGVPIRTVESNVVNGKYKGEKKETKGNLVFYKIILEGEGIETNDRLTCKVMKKVSLKKFIECYRKIIKKYDNLIKIFVKIIKNICYLFLE